MNDYISRDALIKFANNSTIGIDANDIARFPGADVEPVRHAKWREETEYYDDEYSECNTRKVFVCSLCGRTERTKQPYCNCGAKMDKE